MHVFIEPSGTNQPHQRHLTGANRRPLTGSRHLDKKLETHEKEKETVDLLPKTSCTINR
jgi:hypothetical protein